MTAKDLTYHMRGQFVKFGVHVERGEWQSLTDGRPQTSTVELYDVSIDSPVPMSMEEWQESCEPNLPWAEDHFQERISGEPLNPGEQYKNWPWYEGGVEEHKQTGKFSHTYMERYWPYDAAIQNGGTPKGIRYKYGDLGGLLRLLRDRPRTRQAYLPIWFPEDIMASWEGERVPCSLGYLIQYNGDLRAWDMWYYMRSVDFNRYFWDDIYMAGRLLQWICEGANLNPGKLHTKIANLHIFQAEFGKLKADYDKEMTERLTNAL